MTVAACTGAGADGLEARGSWDGARTGLAMADCTATGAAAIGAAATGEITATAAGCCTGTACWTGDSATGEGTT